MTELLKIKKNFNIVKNSRDDIINIFQTLQSKMDTLKKEEILYGQRESHIGDRGLKNLKVEKRYMILP